MRRDRIILLLVEVAIVLSILLITGIGYAVETDDNILLAPNQPYFNVAFTGRPTYTGNGDAVIKIIGDTTAIMDITGLNNVGDSVTARFTIENMSDDISADIYSRVTNSNTEYFKITSTLSEAVIRPLRGEITLEVTVELIKLPIDKDEKTDIYINIFAKPNQNI